MHARQQQQQQLGQSGLARLNHGQSQQDTDSARQPEPAHPVAPKHAIESEPSSKETVSGALTAHQHRSQKADIDPVQRATSVGAGSSQNPACSQLQDQMQSHKEGAGLTAHQVIHAAAAHSTQDQVQHPQHPAPTATAADVHCELPTSSIRPSGAEGRLIPRGPQTTEELIQVLEQAVEQEALWTGATVCAADLSLLSVIVNTMSHQPELVTAKGRCRTSCKVAADKLTKHSCP